MVFTIGHQEVIWLMMTIFAVLGFWRGIRRELMAFGGVVVATWAATTQVAFLRTWTNRFYKIAVFAMKGGLAADPGTVSLGPIEDLVSTTSDELWMRVLVFGAIVIVFYLLAHSLVRRAPNRSDKLMGLVVGAVNGFLVSRFVYPKVFPTQTTHVAILSGKVSEKLTASSMLALVLVALVVTLIIYGVRASSRPPSQRC